MEKEISPRRHHLRLPVWLPKDATRTKSWTQRNRKPINKEKPVPRLNSSKPFIELLWWWTCQIQNIPRTHQQHQVACNDQMTVGPTAMLWLVQAQKTISLESSDSWLSTNQSEIRSKDLRWGQRLTKCFLNAKERCLPIVIQFINKTIKLPSPVRSFSLGEISAHTRWSSFWRSAFRNTQGTPR